jgi:hypothetical protein
MIKRKETLSLDRSDKLSVQALLALVESFTTKNQFYEVSMECTTSNDWAGHQTE